MPLNDGSHGRDTFLPSDTLFDLKGTGSDRLVLTLPSIAFVSGNGTDNRVQMIGTVGDDALKSYLKNDLDVDDLNQILKHLWLAGLPQSARPLHYQRLLDRKIIITERAGLHLLWQDKRIYLKPLPDYLMSYDIWHNVIQKDLALLNNARGFLLSYLWLIRHKSDFHIAQREDLICRDLTWEQWTAFSTAVAPAFSSPTLENINLRYLHGELRLKRINLIYRLWSVSRKPRYVIRGYFSGYSQYSNLVQQNFAWMLTAIVYVTIVLTAMQVGLGTEQLRENHAFNQVSYGVTVFAIVAPMAIFLVVTLVLLVLVFLNLFYALDRRSAARRAMPALFKYDDQADIENGDL